MHMYLQEYTESLNAGDCRQQVTYTHVLTYHMSTHTRTEGDRLLSLCQINSHFLSVVNKCFREFPKGCRIAPSVCACVCLCVHVHVYEHLTGLMGQPVTTKMAKQLVGQQEINPR